MATSCRSLQPEYWHSLACSGSHRAAVQAPVTLAPAHLGVGHLAVCVAVGDGRQVPDRVPDRHSAQGGPLGLVYRRVLQEQAVSSCLL